MRWTPFFEPKSGGAKVEPAGSVLVVVVSCELGCRPVPGTRNCPTPVRGDGVQVAAGAPRSGAGAKRRTWRRSSTVAPTAGTTSALMRPCPAASTRRTRPASDSPTTYAAARHCRTGSSVRSPRAPRVHLTCLQAALPLRGATKMSRSTRGQNPALLSGRRGAATADLQGATVRDDPKLI